MTYMTHEDVMQHMTKIVLPAFTRWQAIELLLAAGYSLEEVATFVDEAMRRAWRMMRKRSYRNG
jgi:hypothetical protein